MRKSWIKAVLGSALAAAMLLPQALWAQQGQAKAPEPLKFKVGDTAPDFTLLYYDGKDVKKVSLHDYRGKKNVALAFFVFAFTGG